MGDARDSFPRWLVSALVGCLGVWLLYLLRGVLAPVFFAFLLAYMLDPLVDRMEARRIPRGAGIGILLSLVFLFVAVLLFVGMPILIQDLRDFVRSLPAQVVELRTLLEPILLRHGIEIPSSVSQALEDFHLDTQGMLAKGLTPIKTFLGWILGGTASAIGAIVAGLMVPVFAFYLLYDFDRLVARAGSLVPPRYRSDVFGFFSEVDQVLGQFFRGQFTVMAILAVLYGAGYALAGVPLAVPIGLVAGLVSFIPYVGGAMALVLALFMSLLDWQGWEQILWVLVAYSVVQLVESFIVTPKIMGDKVGVSAVVVLFAVLAGGELLGFTGVLLAVPAAAVGKIVLARTTQRYRESAFYGAEAGPGDARSS